MIIKNELKDIDKVKLLIFDIDNTLTIFNTLSKQIEQAFKEYSREYKVEYLEMLKKTVEHTIKIAENEQYLNTKLLNEAYEYAYT